MGRKQLHVSPLIGYSCRYKGGEGIYEKIWLDLLLGSMRQEWRSRGEEAFICPMYPAKMNHRTGGQFGAQRILCKVVNHGTGGQFGAQGSQINLDYKGSSSDTETEIDESDLDPYLIDSSSARYAQISERARKTLQQTSLLSKLYVSLRDTKSVQKTSISYISYLSF
ncbi:hypothetical protein Pst134EB_021872 [Puccinia striiformis f. sp. tritici]|nr:hypothetical protein Pst134EB_021872 [Puccinia striiformis f. sp. tritici]